MGWKNHLISFENMTVEELGSTLPLSIRDENVMRFHTSSLVNMIRNIAPEQVNIGADTGRNNLPEPSKEQILELIARLENFRLGRRRDER